MVYCPACDREYPNLESLRTHLLKAQSEGDAVHIDVIELEGWFTTSQGLAESVGNEAPKEVT